MTTPLRIILRTLAAMAAILIYLTAVELALPSSRKADRLPLFPYFNACAVIDYQQGACL